MMGQEHKHGQHGEWSGEVDGGPDRALAAGLRGLRDVATPGSLLPDVLVRTGLGDVSWRVDTPIGPVWVAYNARGVSAVLRGEGADGRDADARARLFRARFGRPLYPTDAPPADVARRVEARLQGDTRARVSFDVRSASDFERAVLGKAAEIPRGEVRPYAWVAREIGRPSAVRAVGSALGHNPIPLLIPCHRVVRSDGRIDGYVFGDAAKEAMLTAEGVDLAALEGLARAGVRYIGSDTTHIFCVPTCRNARRIAAPHRVPFASDDEARAAGYRACKVCRPAPAA